jgi:hypothetical protein
MRDQQPMTSSSLAPRAPQITLFLDAAGQVHAEAAGKNGSRRKIAFDELSLPYELYSDLIEQQASERERAKEERARLDAEREATHKRIVAYTSLNYPSALKYVANESDKGAKSTSKKARLVKTDLDKAIASIQL